MRDAVLISLIVPVYNPGRYLADCLKSLSAQAGDDTEFLLIDDGSTDGSAAALDGFALSDKRARVFHRENAGVSATRNFGLDNASGRWLCFLDSDDILHSRFVSRVRPYLTDQRDMVFYSWSRFSRDDASDLVEDIAPGEHECTRDELRLLRETTICPSQPLVKTAMRFRGSVGILGFLARADIVRDMGLRFIAGMKLSEDSAFRLRLMGRCLCAVCISDVLYFYRKNLNAATTAYNARVADDLLFTMSAMRAIVRDEYADDAAMVARCRGMTVNVSVNFFNKFLFHKQNPMSEDEKLAAYAAFRRLDFMREGITECDRGLLQKPFDALLDAMRIDDARRSMRAARAALKPGFSLRFVADRLGVLPTLKRLLRRLRST